MAPDGYTVTPSVARELGRDALALGDEPVHAVVHLVAEVEREPARDLGGRSQVVRQHDLLELVDHPCRCDREAEAQRGHRPHLRVGAHDHERAVVAHELERAPRRELAVGLVDDDEVVAVGREQRLDGGGGLDGAGGVVGAAHEHDRRRVLLDERTGDGGIDREVGASLPHHHLGAGDPGDVRVQRVRGLEHRGAPPGAAVGEQQRLQHLVGTVGAEQALGGLAEVRAERVAQARARRGRDSG